MEKQAFGEACPSDDQGRRLILPATSKVGETVPAHQVVFVVRSAKPDETGELVALMQEFYAESGYELDESWASASLAALLGNPALGSVWIADAQGVSAGYAVLTVRYTMEFGGLSGYVDDLFVRPRRRRQGAASALLDQAFDECRARGCKSVQVEVGKDNVAARALYAEFGLVARQDGRVLLSGSVSGRHP